MTWLAWTLAVVFAIALLIAVRQLMDRDDKDVDHREELSRLQRRITELALAISHHRAAKDRLWRCDAADCELYRMLGDQQQPGPLPELPEYMRKCAEHWQQRVELQWKINTTA